MFRCRLIVTLSLQLALLFELLGALQWWRKMWVGFVLVENKVLARLGASLQ